jgi:CheY-like chemotaxis protein/HPt (histidine-containing phosphotransfer) domain-containing protein
VKQKQYKRERTDMKDKDFSKIRINGSLPSPQEIEIPPEAEEFLNDLIESISSKLPELEAAALACEHKEDCREELAAVRRILHSIKGEAGISGINDVYEFCHQVEFAVNELQADKLPDMLLNVNDWLEAAVQRMMNKTVIISQPNITNIKSEGDSEMKYLIVEDDFAARKLLQRYLVGYGECDFAANGIEAVAAFKDSLDKRQPYNLICLDVMMPQMDGQETLKEIRKIEYERNIRGLDCAKIVMTTALNDSKNVKRAFNEQCDGYLVKPIERSVLIAKLIELGIIKNPVSV